MDTIKTNRREEIAVLSENEVIQLHNLLTTHPDIQNTTEPVSPSGIRDKGLLSSAVHRQHTGHGDVYIYDNIFSNCATLVFGIACNHSFHNGNKRAALLCMIKHLFKNGYVLDPNLRNDEVTDFFTAIAAGKIDEFAYKYSRSYKNLHNSLYKKIKNQNNKIENDLKFIENWIRTNSESKNQVDRPLRWQYLIKKLEKFGLEIETSTDRIYITQRNPRKFFNITLKERVITQHYPYKGGVCNIMIVKDIRRDFNLNTKEGFDNVIFYSDEENFMDYQIQTFKMVIYKLSKK